MSSCSPADCYFWANQGKEPEQYLVKKMQHLPKDYILRDCSSIIKMSISLMTIHIQYVILIQFIHNKQAVFGSLAEFVKQYFQGLEIPYWETVYGDTKFISCGWGGNDKYFIWSQNTVNIITLCSLKCIAVANRTIGDSNIRSHLKLKQK